MGAGRVVEQARERAEHVIVVVEHLVVEPARTRVPLDEDRVRSVDLDLPDVVIDEERRQRPVAAEVAERAVDDALRVGDWRRPDAALEVDVPTIDLVHEHGSQRLGTLVVETCALRAVLHPALDLEEG